jgi:segregation and condensation protein A
MDFAQLVADCSQNMTVVGRFLSLLELYKLKAVDFDQEDPLGNLYVEWTGKTFTDDELERAMGE